MILLGFVLALGCALYDKGKIFVNHTPRFLFRVAVALLLAKIGVNNIWDWIINVIIIGVGFYMTFDYILNILEKRKWNYIGDTAKIDIFTKYYLGWTGILIIKILLTLTVLLKSI